MTRPASSAADPDPSHDRSPAPAPGHAASKTRLRHDKPLVVSRAKDSVYATARAEDILWLLDHIVACARAVEGAQAAAREAAGLDGPSRRVLMDLHDGGPRPVPVLAAALGVTRQAVQPIVDARVATGHVELVPNRAKRRSPLVRLTEAGFRLVTELNDRDLDAAARLGPRFLASHVVVTRRTLANLIFALTGARAWELPPLRASYAAVYAPASGADDTRLNRHPLAGAGLTV
jgi:DNA-binding MarR family transcriptional regulator